MPLVPTMLVLKITRGPDVPASQEITFDDGTYSRFPCSEIKLLYLMENKHFAARWRRGELPMTAASPCKATRVLPHSSLHSGPISSAK